MSFTFFQDKTILDLQAIVDKLEGETGSLASKLSESEKSLSELESLFKSSEELCGTLKTEKLELEKVNYDAIF